MSRTRAEEVNSRKLSTVDITAANGAASRIPASQPCPIWSVKNTAVCGMMPSALPSIPGKNTRAQQKITTSGK